jgi:hypothetical protein
VSKKIDFYVRLDDIGENNVVIIVKELAGDNFVSKFLMESKGAIW